MTTIYDTNSILSVILIRIHLDYYKPTPESTPTSYDLCFSDGADREYTNDGYTYLGLGKLMSISSSASELTSSSGEITITISGIPNSSIYEIVNSRVKGSPVVVERAYFNPNTLEPLNFTSGKNTTGRYLGFINNYSLNEEYDYMRKSNTNTIVLQCSSSIDFLSNKYGGRKTNPYSENRYFPNDRSMDRVPTLQNATFDFGKKTT
jgi:hypothetical protein